MKASVSSTGRKVGVGKIAIIVGVFFVAQGAGGTGFGIELAGLLTALFRRFQ